MTFADNVPLFLSLRSRVQYSQARYSSMWI